MHVTALGAQGLPDQRRWHGHGRLPEMGPAQRERLWVGLRVQPIAPHHAGLGDWHMQQPALKKVRDWQGHPLKPRARAGSLLLPGAIGEGGAVPVPRHKPGILEGAAAQIAGEIRDYPRAVRIALHNPHVPLRLRRVAQAVQEVEHLLRSHRLRQGQRATRQGLPERRHHLPPKDRHDHPCRQEKPIVHRLPVPIWRQATACDQTMHMGMQHQGLAPGVERSNDPRLRAEILGVRQ